VKRPLALVVPSSSAASNLAAAQTPAIEGARTDAERLCKSFGSGSLYRYKGAQPVA
jgi:hypothetical protein